MLCDKHFLRKRACVRPQFKEHCAAKEILTLTPLSQISCAQIKSIGVPFCYSTAKGISIGRSFLHILCHIAILPAKSDQDGQKGSYSHPSCQRRGPIERRATASLERASSELLWLPCHRPSVRGLRTMQGDHLCWKVLCAGLSAFGLVCQT